MWTRHLQNFESWANFETSEMASCCWWCNRSFCGSCAPSLSRCFVFRRSCALRKAVEKIFFLKIFWSFFPIFSCSKFLSKISPKGSFSCLIWLRYEIIEIFNFIFANYRWIKNFSKSAKNMPMRSTGSPRALRVHHQICFFSLFEAFWAVKGLREENGWSGNDFSFFFWDKRWRQRAICTLEEPSW